MGRNEQDHSWRAFFQSELEQLRRSNRLRKTGGSSFAQADSIDFGSNDYLGLRSHPKIFEALSTDIEAWGSGASPVLSGWGEAHAQLERSLAELSAMESAIAFSSGYTASVGTLAAMLGPNDLVFSDALNHACLIDGIRLSKAQRFIYPHCDLAVLREQLESCTTHAGRKLIVTESIFSMDGDKAPLRELADLANEFQCGLAVDEAHATGVYGEHGGGLLEELNLQQDVLLKLGTLSKAFGGIGGFAAGSQDTISFLVNKCRSYVFSTAPPAPAMLAAHVAISLAQEMHEDRQQLRAASRELRDQLRSRGWQTLDGDSPIIPVIVGSEQAALDLSERLAKSGLTVPAIRPPTVPVNTCRLRISLSTKHSPADLSKLVDVLGDADPIPTE